MSFGFTWIQATEDGSIMSIQANDDREVGKETQEIEANQVGDLRGVEAAHRHVAVGVDLLGVGLATVKQESVANLKYYFPGLLWNICEGGGPVHSVCQQFFAY